LKTFCVAIRYKHFIGSSSHAIIILPEHYDQTSYVRSDSYGYSKSGYGRFGK